MRGSTARTKIRRLQRKNDASIMRNSSEHGNRDLKVLDGEAERQLHLGTATMSAEELFRWGKLVDGADVPALPMPMAAQSSASSASGSLLDPGSSVSSVRGAPLPVAAVSTRRLYGTRRGVEEDDEDINPLLFDPGYGGRGLREGGIGIVA